MSENGVAKRRVDINWNISPRVVRYLAGKIAPNVCRLYQSTVKSVGLRPVRTRFRRCYSDQSFMSIWIFRWCANEHLEDVAIACVSPLSDRIPSRSDFILECIENGLSWGSYRDRTFLAMRSHDHRARLRGSSSAL